LPSDLHSYFPNIAVANIATALPCQLRTDTVGHLDSLCPCVIWPRLGWQFFDSMRLFTIRSARILTRSSLTFAASVCMSLFSLSIAANPALHPSPDFTSSFRLAVAIFRQCSPIAAARPFNFSLGFSSRIKSHHNSPL
jgi:hypothetical protein